MQVSLYVSSILHCFSDLMNFCVGYELGKQEWFKSFWRDDYDYLFTFLKSFFSHINFQLSSLLFFRVIYLPVIFPSFFCLSSFILCFLFLPIFCLLCLFASFILLYQLFYFSFQMNFKYNLVWSSLQLLVLNVLLISFICIVYTIFFVFVLTIKTVNHRSRSISSTSRPAWLLLPGISLNHVYYCLIYFKLLWGLSFPYTLNTPMNQNLVLKQLLCPISFILRTRKSVRLHYGWCLARAALLAVQSLLKCLFKNSFPYLPINSNPASPRLQTCPSIFEVQGYFYE